MNYSQQHKQNMLDIAWQALQYGLEQRRPLEVDTKQFDEILQCQQATFVTLEKNDQLRGCIGSLQAIEPLIINIAHNSYRAGFEDPRFSPITALELPLLSIHISILSQPTAMVVEDEQDLLTQLQPNIDGLILKEHGYQSTFLPSVWHSLPKAKDFVQQLKLKAGLPQNYWSDTICFYRYHSIVIE